MDLNTDYRVFRLSFQYNSLFNKLRIRDAPDTNFAR